jgi:hypothetical protein
MEGKERQDQVLMMKYYVEKKCALSIYWLQPSYRSEQRIDLYSTITES